MWIYVVKYYVPIIIYFAGCGTLVKEVIPYGCSFFMLTVGYAEIYLLVWTGFGAFLVFELCLYVHFCPCTFKVFNIVGT